MRTKCQYLLLLLLLPTLLLAGCGGDDTEEAADASVVTTLDLTVASVTTDPSMRPTDASELEKAFTKLSPEKKPPE